MRSMMPVVLVFLGLIALMTVFFEGVIDRRHQPNRTLVVGAEGSQRVSLKRNRLGQYIAPGAINTESVDFLVDTGADSVAVPGDVAERAGLPRGPRVLISTAGGQSTGYQTEIERVALGGIVMQNVPALIVPDMGGQQVLLGMTFLRHVDFRQQGDQLVIEPAN